jgi:hypothetical protein
MLRKMDQQTLRQSWRCGVGKKRNDPQRRADGRVMVRTRIAGRERLLARLG